ncbi:MAG: nuclear transport factor 2 family protein [Vulcanimicrobiota bacterium]
MGEAEDKGLSQSVSLVHQWFRRVWEEGDLDAIEELMHPDNLSVGLVNDPVGMESFKSVYTSFGKLVTDIAVKVEDAFEDGDRVAGRWLMSVTHRATGKRIHIPCALFARTKDGKFLECSNYFDYLDFFVQTGALPDDTLARCMDERRVGVYAGALGTATVSDMQRVWEADESHFKALFETSVASMVLVDTEDRILSFNRTFAKQFCDSDAELIGTPFHHFVHAADSAEEAQLFEHLAQSKGGEYQLELRLLRGEAVMWVQLSTVGPQQTSEGKQILRSLQDITTQRLEQMVRFQERERRLLATDLHDALAQNLALLVVQMQTASALQDRDEARRQTLLDDAVKLGQSISKELSGMMKALRSPVVEGVELTQALSQLSLDLNDENFQVSFHHALDRPIPSGLASLFAYRIIQEAIQNARRHGRARVVKVSLSLSGGRLKGRVTDDGCGFVPGASGGTGLLGMGERCELLGGRLSLSSEVGVGTSVRFELPVVERA